MIHRGLRRTIVALAILAALPAAANPRTDRTVDADAIRRLIVEEAMATPMVPPSLALAVAKVESNFRGDALSTAGARGVMQIMPATARGEFGVDPDELWEPRLNVQLGIDFLGRLIERYRGRWDLALSHYNAGSVAGALPNARPLPVARPYVEAVLGWEKTFRESGEASRLAEARTKPDAWSPANTRIAAAPRPVPEPAPPLPAREASVPAVRTPAAPLARRTVTAGLDDFGGDLRLRRLAVRSQLDDFSPRIRWIPG